MKTKALSGALILAAIGAMPARAHAAPSPVPACRYVTNLHAVIVDLNKLVQQLPKLGNKDAHDRALAVDIRFAHFQRKATPLPLDLNRAFAATVQNLEEGAANRAQHNTDQYNHFYNETHKYMNATWTAFNKHYGHRACK